MTARAFFGAAVAAGAAVALAPVAAADTLIVPDDFGSIQAAIDAAEPADVVLIEPGRYTENITLASSVDVRGRETARTLIAPSDDAVATVSIANVNAVRLSNLTLVDPATGIAVAGSSGIEIANVVFDGAAEVGLSIDAVSSVDVSNNVFFENATALARGSAATVVENNIFRRNGTAIAGFAQPGTDPAANVQSNCFSDNENGQDDGVGDDEGDGDDGSLGVGATVGDPLFVDPGDRDFHLQHGSPCIDAGRGTDVIDNTTADAGVYGGPSADAVPFPVAAPALGDATDPDTGSVAIDVDWPPNLDHRITNPAAPGGYLLYYERGGDGTPPLEGTDAGGGTMPSPIDVGDATSFTLEDLEAAAGKAPLAPRFLNAAARNQAAVLTWEASSGANGYRIHYGVDDVSENVEVVGDVTTATVTGLDNDTTYRFAIAALNQPRYHVAIAAYDNTPNRNESVVVDVASIDVGDAAESPLSQELTATPGATQPQPDLPDEGCFIATAAFGADWTFEVRVLREFRDRLLATHAPGRWLVRRYYEHGPRGAAWLNEHESWKPAVRATLLPWVGLALVLLEAPWLAAAVLLGLIAVPPLARRRRLRSTPRHRRVFPRGRRVFPRVRISGLALSLAAAVAAGGLAAPSARAQGAVNAQGGDGAAAPDAQRFSPRWMYELKGGYYYPDIDRYEEFYDDDRDTIASVSGAWRARDWLEVGAEIGYLRGKGIGVIPGTGEPGAAVTLKLFPAQVFANFIWQPEPGRRFVPYGGVGIAAVWYEQDIELEPGRDGRTDIGPAARAGVRFLIGSQGSRRGLTRGRGEPYVRSYVFAEVQTIEADVDGIDLGGESYQLGFRFEFELGR